MKHHHKINYLEIPVTDMRAAKQFFRAVFDWRFTDYGKDYCAFDSGGIEGGFYTCDLSVQQSTGSVLVVFYSDNLELTQRIIESNGGKVCQSIFEFPGGRRFHFEDPNGNEFAVWSSV